MRHITYILLLLVSLPMLAQDTISLERFLALAEQQALGRLGAEQAQASAALEYEIFRASLRPQLRAFANLPNYNKTFGEVTQPDGTILFQPIENNNSVLGLSLTQQLPGTGGTVFVQSSLQRFDDLESDFSLYNGLPFRIGLSQPIFAFNPQRWERQLAPLRKYEAEQQFEINRQEVRQVATDLFFNLLLAQQENTLADSNFVANQRLYKIAEERYALGKISRRDLIQLELELTAAQGGQQRATLAVGQTSADLAVYLGLLPEQLSYSAIEPVPQNDVMADEEAAIIWSRNNRPEWTTFQRRTLEAQQALAEAKRTDGPELALTASFGRIRSSTKLSDIYRESLPETFIQLQVNVPILDWGQRRKRAQIARGELELAEATVTREALALDNNIRQTVRQFNSLQQELLLMRRVRELSEERFRITTESYILGAIQLTELTLAQREKDQAQRTYLNTLRSYYQALAQWQGFFKKNES